MLEKIGFGFFLFRIFFAGFCSVWQRLYDSFTLRLRRRVYLATVHFRTVSLSAGVLAWHIPRRKLPCLIGTTWLRQLERSKSRSRKKFNCVWILEAVLSIVNTNGGASGGREAKKAGGTYVPTFWKYGLVIRPNLHRNSKGGVGVGRICFGGQYLSGKLVKLVPTDVTF